MKTPARFAAFLVPILSAVAAEPVKFQIVVNGIPSQSSEVVLVLDTVAPPAPNYDDPAPPAAQAPAQIQKAAPQVAPAVDPSAPPVAAGEEPPRRRRRFAGAGAVAAPAVAAVRESVDPKGSATATLSATVPAGENYQARIVALRGDDPFPTVLAGGRIDALKIAAGATSAQTLTLKSPALKLSAENPSIVPLGSRFHLAGVITDAAHALGTKNRMRVWISEDAPPAANYAGRQVSTIDVTTKGDDVEFNFELTAPKRATTLFFQFGELPSDFARNDGRQAPFVVLPDLSSGASPLQLAVK